MKAFSDTQASDVIDGMLRYADAQVKEGNMAEAMTIYKSALERRTGALAVRRGHRPRQDRVADAAAAILPKLKSDNRKVRITAENAWKSMAGTKA